MNIDKFKSSHYSVGEIEKQDGMEFLHKMFPTGTADDMNFVLFSTSGVHGSYCTIEDAERFMDEVNEELPITFLCIQPRLVCIRYGLCVPTSLNDINFLKGLRDTSHAAIADIGVDFFMSEEI